MEIATSYLHGKHGVEIRIWSVNRESHSVHQNSCFTTTLWCNWNHNEIEIPEDQFEKYSVKLDAKDFAWWSKAKTKPQRRELAGSWPWTVPVGQRFWTDVHPGKYSFSDFEASKQGMHLLRHSQHVYQDEDGAIQFLRNWRKSSETFLALPSLVWQQVESMHGKRRSERTRSLNKERYEVFTILFLHEHEAKEGTLNGRSVDLRAYHQATEFDRGAGEVIRIFRCSIPKWRILPHFGNICWMDRIICMILNVRIKIHPLQHGMEDWDTKKYGQEIWTANEVLQLSFHHVLTLIGNISWNEEGSSWLTFQLPSFNTICKSHNAKGKSSIDTKILPPRMPEQERPVKLLEANDNLPHGLLMAGSGSKLQLSGRHFPREGVIYKIAREVSFRICRNIFRLQALHSQYVLACGSR